MIGELLLRNEKDGSIPFRTTYRELILNGRTRSMFCRYLSESKSLTAVCGCSEDQPVPVTISEKEGIRFSKIHPHKPGCAKHINALADAILRSGMCYYVSDGTPVPVAFQITPSGRQTRVFISASEASSDHEAVSLAWLIQHSVLSSHWKLYCEKLTCSDGDSLDDRVLFQLSLRKYATSTKGLLSIDQSILYGSVSNPDPGSFSFIYGRVISVNLNYKKKVYVGCDSFLRKISVSLDRSVWDSSFGALDPACGDYYIAGFVRHKVKDGEHAKNLDKVDYEHSLMNCCIFYASPAGVMCYSPEELMLARKFEELQIPYARPYLPIPRMADLPVFLYTIGDKEYLVLNGFDASEELLKITTRKEQACLPV